jgi:hypothetical protein
MNCKPGDLAIVVSARTAGNLGKLVLVIEWISSGGVLADGTVIKDDVAGGWLCSGRDLAMTDSLGGVHRREYVAFRDSSLRPIRDNDGEDEILRIAGKPIDSEVPV